MKISIDIRNLTFCQNLQKNVFTGTFLSNVQFSSRTTLKEVHWIWLRIIKPINFRRLTVSIVIRFSCLHSHLCCFLIKKYYFCGGWKISQSCLCCWLISVLHNRFRSGHDKTKTIIATEPFVLLNNLTTIVLAKIANIES